MMTLELQLEGLMASWCSDPKARYRFTQQVPSKTALVGFLACALGRQRGQSLRDLHDLDIKIGEWSVGDVFTDYHTIRDAITYSGVAGRSAITYREYVTDPRYQVFVKGDTALIQELADAVRRPRWPLYLGRRSCVLTRPPFVSLTEAA